MSGVWDYLKAINWHAFVNYRVWGINNVHIFGWQTYKTGPIIVPLWFLRDLIVVTIFSPAVYLYIKKTGRMGLILLFILYCFDIWTQKPGFSITAFFYFSLGAYEAINRNNIAVRSKQLARVSVPISVVLFVLCVVLYGSGMIWGRIANRVYIIATIISIFGYSGYLVEKYCVKPNKLLTNSCFFIYASHTLAIFIKWTPITFVSMVFHKIIPGSSGFEDGLCYMLTPFAVALLCVFLYSLLQYYLPNTTAVFNGHRC